MGCSHSQYSCDNSHGFFHNTQVLVPLPAEGLSLQGCQLTDEGLEHITEALRNENARIRGLNIGYNQSITKGALRQLMDAVRTNVHLRTLDLSSTGEQEREDPELAEMISAALVQNRSLRLVSTTYHRVEPAMLRGDCGGQHVFVDCMDGAFPETYEMLLPLNRVSTTFTFVHFRPAALRGLRDHATLRTLSIEVRL